MYVLTKSIPDKKEVELGTITTFVSPIEAFALPLSVETSSAKPHLMIYDPLSASRRQRHYVQTVKTHYGHV